MAQIIRRCETGCDFCREIRSEKDFLTTNASYNCITYDETNDKFDLVADTGDPFEIGFIENVNFCPYCGRNLRKE